MDDRDLFQKMMAQWGVKQENEDGPPEKPAGKTKPQPPAKVEEPLLDPEADLFHRTMGRMGVQAEQNQAIRPNHQRRPKQDPAAERVQFEAALEHLELPADESKESAQERKQRLLKKKLHKKELHELGATLDLHGQTAEEAVKSLSSFVARCFATDVHTVLVITGKGLRSKGGVSVLRPTVEQWVLKRGKRFIESYAEAPRAYGGRGAFILYLRKS